MSEAKLEIKKNREVYEIRTFFGSKDKKGSTTYSNTIDKNPSRLAQVLLDIELIDDFPVEKAVKIYLQKKHIGDWLS